MDKLKVIYVEPGSKPRSIEINDDISDMQDLVGGLIEEYMPFEDPVALVCNDEGKLNGMELNRAILGDDGQVQDIIAGPFFICYAPIESEKFLSLPEDLEKKYSKKFEKPEQFFMSDTGIKVVQYEPISKQDRESITR